MKAFILQVAVVSNHQNGRDTHVRQLRVYGPRPNLNKMVDQDISFTTPLFQSFTNVR